MIEFRRKTLRGADNQPPGLVAGRTHVELGISRQL